MKKFHLDVLRARNINDDHLYKEIIAVLHDAADDLIIPRQMVLTPESDYRQFAEFINMYFEDLHKDRVVVQYDVICDKRNNKDSDLRKSVIHMDLNFVQKHCVNTTQILTKFYT